jgi:DNA adenine methylase
MAASAPTLFDLTTGPASVAARPRRPTPSQALPPLLKWPGGKSGELDRILPAMPDRFDRYFEPFVGGGAVFFAVPDHVPAFVNDASTDLMDFYALVRKPDQQLLTLLEQLDDWWQALESFTEATANPLVEEFGLMRGTEGGPSARLGGLVASDTQSLRSTVPSSWSDLADSFVDEAARIVPAKMLRMRKIEGQRRQLLPEPDIWANIEGAFKASCYTTLRSRYNLGRRLGERSARQAALFFFLREYAYAAMFRFNSKGDFNVPYGGISYNRKAFSAKIGRLQGPLAVRRLQSSTLSNADFAQFLDRFSPERNDFVFLDPPYDSDFSNYDLHAFGKNDHRRLAALMAELPCAFQMVVKSTPDVLEIYGQDDWNVVAFDKKYMWTIKERNNRDATHLMITNYHPAAQIAI